MVNALSEVKVLLNPDLIPIPPFVITFIQAINSYTDCLALTTMLDRLTTNCLQYEAVLDLEELASEAEHLYIFYPRFEWMEDSFCHTTVITDSHWVNQLVGEDQNDVMDFDGNNNK